MIAKVGHAFWLGCENRKPISFTFLEFFIMFYTIFLLHFFFVEPYVALKLHYFIQVPARGKDFVNFKASQIPCI